MVEKGKVGIIYVTGFSPKGGMERKDIHHSLSNDELDNPSILTTTCDATLLVFGMASQLPRFLVRTEIILVQEEIFYKNIVANPNNTKKPTTSVTVVNITEPAKAGSILRRFNNKGINTPDKAAKHKLVKIAEMTINAKLS